jgi:phage-related baseplate assembly protein
MSVIDLSRLPPPEVVEVIDFEEILTQRKADLLAAMPEAQRDAVAEVLQLESEPLVKLLEESVYREILLRQRINEAARSLMLAYAQGSDLDHIGATYYATSRQLLNPGDPDATPPVPTQWETDADYARRLMLAYDSWSTAGSQNSYIYHALSAHPDIRDASAINRGAGEVLVSVLGSSESGTPTTEALQAVEAALSAEKVRPLNDQVTIQPASITTYDVVATIETMEGPSTKVVEARAAESVRAYVDERSRLGMDVVRGAIAAALYVEGVERATLHQPSADILCDETQAGRCLSVQVTAHG